MDLHLATLQTPHNQLGCRPPRRPSFNTAQQRMGRVFVSKKPGATSSWKRTRESCIVQAEAENAAVGQVTQGSNVRTVTDKDFDEVVLDSPVPVIVDFWAPWCGPCRMIAPFIDELSQEYGDKALCVKLNTDESAGTANKYGIRSIPTVIMFKNGAKVETVVGAVPKQTLKQKMDQHMD